MDPEKQTAPDHSRRMKAGEILLGKPACLEQDHGKGISKGQHNGGARSRGKIQWAGFLFNVHVEKNVAVSCKGRVRVAAKGDDFDLKPSDGRQDPKHFFSLAACA